MPSEWLPSGHVNEWGDWPHQGSHTAALQRQYWKVSTFASKSSLLVEALIACLIALLSIMLCCCCYKPEVTIVMLS